MIRSIAACAGGGLLLALAFPPTGWDFAAWVAFIPLFQAIQSQDRPSGAALLGGVFGAVFSLVDLIWMYDTMIIHGHFRPLFAMMLFLGMILTLASFGVSFGLGLFYFLRKGLNIAFIAPFLWAGLEYIRAVIFTGFPWDLTGYSQSARLSLIQLADITGVYGVSFLILLVNVSLWKLLRACFEGETLPWRLLASGAFVLIMSLTYGHYKMQAFPKWSQSNKNFPISVLQGNIPQDIKWEETEKQRTFITYEELGRTAVEEGAKLLVWPETSAPVLIGERDSESRATRMISEHLGVPMLVGAPSYRTQGGRTSYYNSAFLVNGASLHDRYDKIHLVPFGEYMPLTWLLPLGPGIAARDADYSPGKKMTVMKVQGSPPFSVLICYEAIFPDLARLAVKNGAQMLINITNDGWFGDTGAPFQHLAMSGFRSIENRVPLVRAANTGISAFFDQAGRIVGQIPLQERGVLTLRVPSSVPGGSFYSFFGDVFAWGCLGICIMTSISSSMKI